MEEVWDQIGKRLREAREAAELTVDDVVFRTRIPRSVVEALEAEDFSVFTSPTYAKSFLRQYSDYLSVDAEPWLNALEPASYVSGEAWQPMFCGGEPELPAAKRPVRDPRQKEREETTRGGQWSAVWLMIMTVGLVYGSVKGYQFLEQKFGGDEQPSAKQEVAPAAAKPQAKSAPAEKKADAPEASTTTAGPQSDHTAEATREAPVGNPPRAVIVRE